MKKKWFKTIIVLGIIIVAGNLLATTYNVNPGGSIQDAIFLAINGDTIVVYPGTYYENINFNGKNLVLTSTDPDSPTVVANTIIDGGALNTVVTFENGEDSTCVLTGFTITNGYAEWGGGAYCFSSSPTILKCIFSSNSAYSAGGGMYNYYYSSPTLIDCIFDSNSTTHVILVDLYGGGMYNEYYSSPTLTNCTFSKNSVIARAYGVGSNIQGGGMCNNYYSSPTLTNCSFILNSASDYGRKATGGGMMNSNYSSPTLTDCTFSNNTAYHGGGMRNRDHCNPTLTGCTFSGNSASTLPGQPTVAVGGGISNLLYCNLTLTDCTFSDNSAFVGVPNVTNTTSSPS